MASVTPPPQWTAVCQLEDIPRLGARRVARPRGPDVAVFRTSDDQVYALLDRCPHKGGPLSQGLVFGDHVACPLHNWNIRLDNGRAREPDDGCTPRFAVQLTEGTVSLLTAELAELGIDIPLPVAGPAARACA